MSYNPLDPKDLTRREQEISTSIGGGMNCDKHGVFLTFCAT